MTVGQLKEIIKDLPDDTQMKVFGGWYVRDAWIDPDETLVVLSTDTFTTTTKD